MDSAVNVWHVTTFLVAS